MNRVIVSSYVVGAFLLIFLFIKIRKQQNIINLEKFDEVIGKIGDPVLIEPKLQELAIQAKKLSDNSTYLQIQSQIALMQACQKKFDQAHETLDQADRELLALDCIAQVRLLLERGRVFQQEGNIDQAKKYFEKSYQISKLHDLDYHTINAAHMIAIVVISLQEKIIWNELALSLTLQTKDKKAAQWLAPLYNNLGQNYFDMQEYEKSLENYEKALQLFQNDSRYSDSNLIFARWTIGRCIRALGRFGKAIDLQHALLEEMKKIEQSKEYGMPSEMFFLIRGWIYEELAVIYDMEHDEYNAKEYVELALTDLEDNEMFVITSPERLERLRDIKKSCRLKTTN